MIPSVDSVLTQAAMKLFLEVAPQLPPGYLQGSTGTIAMSMILAAQEIARGGGQDAAEVAELRALFARAAERGGAALQLHEALMTEAGAPAPGASPTALREALASARRLLIALHETVEALDADWARATEREILAHLRASADARRLHLPAV